MRIRSDDDGALVLDGYGALYLEALWSVSELLDCDDPRVRDARMPRAYEDDADEEQWRRLVGPDLAHLFAGQAEIVRRDLGSVTTDARSGSWSFRIPRAHRQAWLSALNGASHTLYVLHDFTPDDMRRELDEIEDPAAALATLQIHLYGSLIALILEDEGYGFPDPDTDPGSGDESGDFG